MKVIFIHPSFLQFGGAERTILDFFNNTKNSLLLTFFKTKKINNEKVFFASKKKPFLYNLLGYKANPFIDKYMKILAEALAKEWKKNDIILFSNFPASLVVYDAIKINQEIKTARIYYFCFEPDKIIHYDMITKYNYLPEEIKGICNRLASRLLSNWKKKDEFIVKKLCKKVLTMSEFAVEQANRIYEFNKCVKIAEYYVDDKKLIQLDKEKAKKILNEKYKLDLKKEDKIILSLSRLEKEKGFLKIMEIAKKEKKAKFIIAGMGKLSKRIRIASRKIKNLFYLGYVPEELLSTIYSASDIFLFLGKEETGGPFVLLEAMHLGNKIIASREGSVFEYVVDKKNGLLVDPENTEEIINAIKEVDNLDSIKYNKEYIKKHCLLEKTLESFKKIISAAD